MRRTKNLEKENEKKSYGFSGGAYQDQGLPDFSWYNIPKWG
jgi:hypothetical protein